MARVNRRLALATAPAEAARRHGAVPIRLDRPLDLFPQAGRNFDYATFADLVEEAATMLSGAGIRDGQRVLIVKRSNFDIPLLAFACARIGAVPVLVHSAVGFQALGVMTERAAPAAVISDAATESAGVLDSVDPTLPRWYVGERGEHGLSLLDTERGPIPPAVVPSVDTPQLVTHSSGTTGVPKLVLHSVHSFAGHARPQITIGKVLRVRDPYLMCLSPVHARCMSGMLAILALGLPLGFLTDTSPENAAELLAAVRPGVVETVPNAFIRWEEVAETRPELFAQTRLFVSSFDAAHPRTIRTLLRAAKPGARYMQAYGQTETGPVTVKSHKLKSRCEHGRCVGRGVLGHTKIRVVDDEGDKVPNGIPGQIFARSSGVTPSYLGSPDQRVDGWWAMGDYGMVSARGCLHLYDRLVDRGSGVESLLAAEDDILEALPQLTEVAIIPMGDGGPAVPLVCTRGDLPLDRAAWAEAVAGLPELSPPVQCRWDDIPHTATWKVKRLEVARRLAAGDLPVLAAAREER
ncbi:class I adenylate-forming enzyme family protein [Streptomyces sp. GXMU-J15]|uniref:Class I adenylate-forming enzyme family protein n=1 Tax=Streptomyces fuscus TaxID=3048495 RepID=A0ABT7J310_9ACTN|nr:class I adenylate-forming enzyme family protein [Streptomyces fuscus]MDL2078747.1 class I adenylate-forming enzyme family protein [Streptomyces fuscus]